MRKLNLSLDSLAVESFEPSSISEAYRGTVRANNSADFTCTPTDCGTCVACNTVEYTCGCTGPRPTLVAHTCGNFTCNPGETCAGDKTCVIMT
jgi:hypothetical protein